MIVRLSVPLDLGKNNPPREYICLHRLTGWGLAIGDDRPELGNTFYDIFKEPVDPTSKVATGRVVEPDYEQLHRTVMGLCGWLEFFRCEYGEDDLDLTWTD